jgi:hypothetical protein
MSSLSAGPAQAASKIAANNERTELRDTVECVTLVQLRFIDECIPSQVLKTAESAMIGHFKNLRMQFVCRWPEIVFLSLIAGS